jgi:hypothetical protein
MKAHFLIYKTWKLLILLAEKKFNFSLSKSLFPKWFSPKAKTA